MSQSRGRPKDGTVKSAVLFFCQNFMKWEGVHANTACLLFSAMSFSCGVIMLQPSIYLFDTDSQQRMGVLQISLCLIFIVVSFSVLSLQQIVELKRESKGINVLSYIGKSNQQIKEYDFVAPAACRSRRSGNEAKQRKLALETERGI